MSWRTYVKKRSGPTKIFFGLRGSFRCGHKARKTLRKNWVFGVFFFCWILYILNGRIWSKNFSRSQFQKSRLVSVRIIQKKKFETRVRPIEGKILPKIVGNIMRIKCERRVTLVSCFNSSREDSRPRRRDLLCYFHLYFDQFEKRLHWFYYILWSKYKWSPRWDWFLIQKKLFKLQKFPNCANIRRFSFLMWRNFVLYNIESD